MRFRNTGVLCLLIGSLFQVGLQPAWALASQDRQKAIDYYRDLVRWIAIATGSSVPEDEEVRKFSEADVDWVVTHPFLEKVTRSLPPHSEVISGPLESHLEKISPDQIHIWDRKNKREEIEKVYGEALIRWIYGTRLGQELADHFLSRGWFSRLYGYYQSSFLSSHKVEQFVQQFEIPMDEFENTSYQSFNEFFIRKFKPEARPFIGLPEVMPAFAEGRYFAYEGVHEEHSFPVKGTVLNTDALLGSSEVASQFRGGPVLVARLNPTDYHRFHFPDDGQLLKTYQIHGSLQSVNPIALKYKEEILLQNERQVSILETKNFGRIAFVEVGAMCIGKIIQTHDPEKVFSRGDEKGYFLFGGSTVIVIGQSGHWSPDPETTIQSINRAPQYF